MAKWVSKIPNGGQDQRRENFCVLPPTAGSAPAFEEQRGSLKAQQQFYTSMIDMRPDWINAGIFFRPCNWPEYCGPP